LSQRLLTAGFRETGDPPLLTRLGTDVILLCDVIFASVKPQADQHGVSDEQFRAADITIVHDELSRLPGIIRMARRSVRIFKQNLFWAFFYNTAAIPFAAFGFVPTGLAVGMCSSISVVLNAMPLRK